MYEIKILPNRSLTIPLFCKPALRSSLECKIGTAVGTVLHIAGQSRFKFHDYILINQEDTHKTSDENLDRADNEVL